MWYAAIKVCTLSGALCFTNVEHHAYRLEKHCIGGKHAIMNELIVRKPDQQVTGMCFSLKTELANANDYVLDQILLPLRNTE